MFAWVVIREDDIAVLAPALARAWSGAAQLVHLELPAKKRGKPPRRIAIASPGAARARRAARWPGVLADWGELNDEPLIASIELAVAGEEVSGLGARTLAAWSGPGLERATVAWYEKGGLVGYEHVGAASVAWDPDGGLGRPFSGTAAPATGDMLLVRAFAHVLEQDPPPIDELAGMVATAPVHTFSI